MKDSEEQLEPAALVHDLHGDHDQTNKKWASATVSLVFIFLIAGSFVFRFQNISITKTFNISKSKIQTNYSRPKFPLKCSNETTARTCKVNYPQSFDPQESSDTVCPEYFRWIHEDLRPWKSTGISRETLEKARNSSNFRLAIINGRAYLEKFHPAFQTRDVFTIWGILQLLRLYPGRVPDLELMFECGDIPLIKKSDYLGPNTTSSPPILFQYCGTDSALNVVFPDWAFWGWAEVNIRPWERTLKGIIKGSKKTKWKKREGYAFWKGNPYVTSNRLDLMKCNLSEQYDWDARLYSQDWIKETKQGFKNSKLEEQCKHRYKIYIEGRGWSVSDKYIIACDSMTLLIQPTYYDFFMRSMVPLHHYWPTTNTNKCKSIKFAVEWGNRHPRQAETIGKRGSEFIKENLKMENVYAYMFQLLKEYAKLQTFKPEIPKGAEEVCSESMACSLNGIKRKFMEESMVISPSIKPPCVMPPPFEPPALQSFLQMKENITKRVIHLENGYWDNNNNNKKKKQYLSSLKFI